MEHTLDVRCTSGGTICQVSLLFSALLAAAKRSVRDPLLLDDNNTPDLGILRCLTAIPRQSRLFNPFSFRLPSGGYITDFSVLVAVCNKSFYHFIDGVGDAGRGQKY